MVLFHVFIFTSPLGYISVHTKTLKVLKGLTRHHVKVNTTQGHSRIPEGHMLLQPWVLWSHACCPGRQDVFLNLSRDGEGETQLPF